MKLTWRKQHKWVGLCICFFLLMFCLSGIVLNHRQAVADMNVSRQLLPPHYRFDKWNGGLMRGTIDYTAPDSTAHVLVYGTGGIWLTDANASRFTDFNVGLPAGADYRNIRAMVQPRGDILLAVSPFALYRYGMHGQWSRIPLATDRDERLSDITMHGDTMVVVGRSYLYISTFPFHSFTKIQLKKPADYDGMVSLFRTVWMIHSGEMFGTIGKLIADIIAIILIFLCLSGFACWLLPKYVKRLKAHGESIQRCSRLSRLVVICHNKAGRATIILTLFIAVTGWCLRPPVMIPLALLNVKAMPHTPLSSDNPWNDRLRMLRYDDDAGDWLLSTSTGFYSLRSFGDIPVKIESAPPVSVMGLNVFEKPGSYWLCGSFGGMFVWDRSNGVVRDYFTHETVKEQTGPPFGSIPISGYSSSFNDKSGGIRPFTIDYYNGTDAITQPAELSTLPMSLWNVALEVHSGRIYIGDSATLFFVFFAGIAVVWCLWSGWKLRRK